MVCAPCLKVRWSAYPRIRIILAHMLAHTHEHCRILAHAHAYSRTFSRMYARIPIHAGAYRNEAFPVLKLYYKQAQSSQEPKRGISSTKVVLQASTIQPEAETRHFPVLELYYKQAQSSREPKRGISSTKVVLQASTIQPEAETRHFQY